ncbi:MAG: FAD-binding oxidoreductase [Armatimonadaceae bacterium]
MSDLAGSPTESPEPQSAALAQACRNQLGLEPGAVVRPETIEEAAEVVRLASERKQVVVPWGGGTGQEFGYTPPRLDVLLDMSGLNRVIGHEPGDLTTTVQAGVTLDALQDALEQHNQFLPLDPPHSHRATLGGILATDAYGASAQGHGTARDWLIGITVVDGAGRIVRGGGKVVKNVTGYDLPKLHIGALGTLGIIVEATFKVAPRPEYSRGLLFGRASETAVQRVHQETTPAMSLLRETAGGSILALIYTGFNEVVQHYVETAQAIAVEEEIERTSLPDGMPPPFTGNPPQAVLAVRVHGKPATVMSRHRALRESGYWSQLDTYPGLGVTDLYMDSQAEPEAAWESLLEWALRNGALVSALRAPLAMRREPAQVALWHPRPKTFPLMERLKITLDPENTLNRGRFVGGI